MIITHIFLLLTLISTGEAFWLINDLPRLIRKFASEDEAADKRRAALEPAYLNHSAETYDYVIIGAGSAGAVVANRLSRNQRNSVLVIQDGGSPTPFSKIPALSDYLKNQPSLDYSYQISKQKNACLAENSYAKNCIINRGKGLGGSSNIFSMSVVRGNPADYNRWAEITGDSNWAYKNVLKVFKKLENYHGHFTPADTRFHGTHGESYISAQQPAAFPHYFYEACAELRLPLNIDPNANQSVGCGHLDLNIKNGVRWGSYRSFLEPVLHRTNLKIYRYAKATKIRFDDTMRAVGVEYVRHGVVRTVDAKHEVILCAGAIDSPKILMLSGIGPTAALQSIGVKQLINLPVGVGLEEHIGTKVEFAVNKNIAFIPERDLDWSVLKQYERSKQGPLASPVFNSRGLAFVTSKEFNDPNWPDLEILFRGQHENTFQNGSYLNKILAQVFLLRPLSKGYLTLNSSDPGDPPIINLQIFSNQSDLRRLIDGVKFAVKLLERTETFKRLNTTLIRIPICKQKFKSRKYYECVLRQNTYTLYHPTGTVRMGRKRDPFAVLNSKLQVRGTKGLRVVDCSIMPSGPAGHTYTPALMIGQMGADFILNF